MTTTHALARFALGVLGGTAGLVAMRLYWMAATALEGEDPRMLTRDGSAHPLDEVSMTGGLQANEDESSTAAVGRMAYEQVTGEAPSKEEKAALSYGVHWTYGLLTTGLYGALRGRAGGADLAGGAGFGAALWALGDELAVPTLGLSQGPTAYPLRQHAHRLGAHLAFGLTTAAATQALFHLFMPERRSLKWRAAKVAGKTYLEYRAAKKAVRVAGRAAGKAASRAADKTAQAAAHRARALTDAVTHAVA